MTIIDHPPTQVRNLSILTTGIWLWNWLPPVFPSSVKVRPADMDGWVEQSGQILLLDGCIGRGRVSKPSAAVSIATKNAKNITYLALSTEPELFDVDTHTPHDITHYCLLPAHGWYPPSYEWGAKWYRIDGARPYGLHHATAMIAQWATWAADLDRARVAS